MTPFSAPAVLVVRYLHWPFDDSIAIPSLRPGETYRAQTRLPTTIGGFWDFYEADNRGDTVTVTGELLLLDADSSNNTRVSPVVHMAMPLIDMTLAMADTDLWVNVPYTARLTISNSSPYAEFTARSAGFYLLTRPSYDQAGLTTFGMHDIPAIPASSDYVEDLVITIPSRASWQHKSGIFGLHPVLMGLGARDSIFPLAYFHPGVTITLHPDYYSCEPALLVPDSLVWAPFICEIPSPFYVFQLEARTDREYSIEQPGPDLPGASIYSAEGVRWRDIYPGTHVRFPEPGTWWIVDYLGRVDDPPPAHSMRLLEWPVPKPMN